MRGEWGGEEGRNAPREEGGGETALGLGGRLGRGGGLG